MDNTGTMNISAEFKSVRIVYGRIYDNIYLVLFTLTHINLSSFCGTSANSAKPDQTPQNAASDQVLHCLQTEASFKI